MLLVVVKSVPSWCKVCASPSEWVPTPSCDWHPRGKKKFGDFSSILEDVYLGLYSKFKFQANNIGMICDFPTVVREQQ